MGSFVSLRTDGEGEWVFRRPANRPSGRPGSLHLNWPTIFWSWSAMLDSSPAAFWVSEAAAEVLWVSLATWVTFWAISEEPRAASARFVEISFVVLVCCSTAAAMALWMSEILLMISPMMCRWPRTAPLVSVLDHLDLLLDVLGGLGRLLGEVLDLVGDDGEALARLAGAGGLDGGVQGEEVGLLGDGADDLDDVADLGARLAELGDLDVGLLRHADGADGHLAGLGDGAGDLLNGSAHLAGADGDRLDALCSPARRTRTRRWPGWRSRWRSWP